MKAKRVEDGGGEERKRGSRSGRPQEDAQPFEPMDVRLMEWVNPFHVFGTHWTPFQEQRAAAAAALDGLGDDDDDDDAIVSVHG